MNNVISLNGNIPQGAVNDDLVIALEILVEQAKQGDIRGMGFFCVNSDRSISTGYDVSGDDLITAVAGASMLNHRINHFLTDDNC